MSKKAAVLFPGIGYLCEKPLLYYGGKLAAELGYEVIPVSYSNFPSGVRGDQKKMEECFHIALEQATDRLKEICWSDYEDILFISKSVGTVVAAAYAKQRELKVRSISFTPLAQTFLFADGDGIMFHGTADPWAEDSEVIREGCKRIGQPLYITEHANHSMETGDVKADLKILQKIMEQVEQFITEGSERSGANYGA